MIKSILKDVNHSSIVFHAQRPLHTAEDDLTEYYDGDTRMYKNRAGKQWNADIYDKNFKVSNNRKVLPQNKKVNQTQYVEGIGTINNCRKRGF